jgi:hypothetical protein
MSRNCENCGGKLTTFREALTKSASLNGVFCPYCGLEYRPNYLGLMLPFIGGFLASISCLFVLSEVAARIVQLVTTVALLLLFYARKPLVVKRRPETAKQLKWYTSPFLFVAAAFCIALYFMFLQ